LDFRRARGSCAGFVDCRDFKAIVKSLSCSNSLPSYYIWGDNWIDLLRFKQGVTASAVLTAGFADA
jgi:hypothetical protein